MAVEKLKIQGKQIVLVGTAHISRKSIELVKTSILKEKPDCVGVELDRQRFEQLKQDQKWLDMDLGRVVKEGKTYLFLINILLANMQRKLGEELGLKPGTEMVEAIKLASEKKIAIALLDRDVRITLKRALNVMGLREKAKLLLEIAFSLFQKPEPLTEEMVEKLKEKDTLNALMQELGKKLPSVKQVLVDERDAFIASRIMQMPGKKVLAVLGAGHLEGVKQLLGKEIDERKLLVLKEKKSRIRYLKYIVPAAFIVLLAYGFYTKGFYAALNLFMLWFLINGVLSALGAALAKAHPFTILVAFLAAPFTSLHPAFAAGWFAAAAEIKVRSPKVRDFHSIQNLESYKDFANNQVTKILLIAAYSNIGSTIGTVIALPYILAMLG